MVEIDSSGSGIPKGCILMWSGSIATIPSGFALCDGSNGTPDLRNRFVIGAKQDVAGVAKTNVLAVAYWQQTGGDISHGLYIDSISLGYTQRATGDNTGAYTYISGDESIYVDELIASTTDDVPPFYALAFIQKL